MYASPHAGPAAAHPPRLRRERPAISCVVPARNESANLAVLLPRLRAVLEDMHCPWEVVVVDDGSTDDTQQLLAGWADEPGFRVLELSRNFGKEAALSAGLEAAAGDVVVMLDADLQHPPSLIPRMLSLWISGADVVYALRQDRDDESWLKREGTRLFYRLVNAGDRFEIPAGAGDFRLMDRAAVDAMLALPERTRFLKGLYAWVGFHATALPYVPQERAHGRSHFNLRRLLALSLDGLTSFTTWPLRIVSVVGALLALASFGYGGYLVLDYLARGNQVSGWTTIVVSMMLFFGMQMLFLGIIGEYVGRIFEEVKQRPLYVVRRALGRGLQGDAR